MGSNDLTPVWFEDNAGPNTLFDAYVNFETDANLIKTAVELYGSDLDAKIATSKTSLMSSIDSMNFEIKNGSNLTDL